MHVCQDEADFIRNGKQIVRLDSTMGVCSREHWISNQIEFKHSSIQVSVCTYPFLIARRRVDLVIPPKPLARGPRVWPRVSNRFREAVMTLKLRRGTCVTGVYEGECCANLADFPRLAPVFVVRDACLVLRS